jgi:hypothetical protein
LLLSCAAGSPEPSGARSAAFDAAILNEQQITAFLLRRNSS